METTMPVILWLLGVPLVVVVALMLTHVIRTTNENSALELDQPSR